MTELSSDVFENINKGIVINHAFVDRDIDGFVVLTDGSGFSRRKKPLKKVESPEELSPEERLKRTFASLWLRESGSRSWMIRQRKPHGIRSGNQTEISGRLLYSKRKAAGCR